MFLKGQISIVKLKVLLWIFFGLFTLRVLGQFLVFMFDIPFFPSFDLWHSNAINYTTLLFIQIIAIIFMTIYNTLIIGSYIKPRIKLGYYLYYISIVYFTIMLFRLVIIILGISDYVWFHRPIPTVFHLVLAVYLFLLSYYHLNNVPKRLIIK